MWGRPLRTIKQTRSRAETLRENCETIPVSGFKNRRKLSHDGLEAAVCQVGSIAVGGSSCVWGYGGGGGGNKSLGVLKGEPGERLGDEATEGRMETGEIDGEIGAGIGDYTDIVTLKVDKTVNSRYMTPFDGSSG